MRKVETYCDVPGEIKIALLQTLALINHLMSDSSNIPPLKSKIILYSTTKDETLPFADLSRPECHQRFPSYRKVVYLFILRLRELLTDEIKFLYSINHSGLQRKRHSSLLSGYLFMKVRLRGYLKCTADQRSTVANCFGCLSFDQASPILVSFYTETRCPAELDDCFIALLSFTLDATSRVAIAHAQSL
ncbi:hypothetical protein RRG08_021582 [Elysia crispata]|uniref:Uncharacterized protein n=1 Tax=Elysia crispata TaxID=231223 RepID=A0AAE1CEE0_9GAST|nr:hypothetical protein RRG08_021582 [Elysia crispata]